MLKRLWLFVLMLTVVIGCGSPLPEAETGYKCSTEGKVLYREVYIDETFAQEERVWIVLSMMEWNRVTNGVASFKYMGTIPHALPELRSSHASRRLEILRVQTSDAMASEKITLWGRANWSYVYLITDRMKAAGGDFKQRLIGVTMHELGHTMGLGHIPETSSLMNAQCTDACADPKVTLYDMNVFCKAAAEGWRWPEATAAFEDHDPSL